MSERRKAPQALSQGDARAAAKTRVGQDAKPRETPAEGPEARQPDETDDAWFERWLRDYWRG